MSWGKFVRFQSPTNDSGILGYNNVMLVDKFVCFPFTSSRHRTTTIADGGGPSQTIHLSLSLYTHNTLKLRLRRLSSVHNRLVKKEWSKFLDPKTGPQWLRTLLMLFFIFLLYLSNFPFPKALSFLNRSDIMKKT